MITDRLLDVKIEQKLCFYSRFIIALSECQREIRKIEKKMRCTFAIVICMCVFFDLLRFDSIKREWKSKKLKYVRHINLVMRILLDYSVHMLCIWSTSANINTQFIQWEIISHGSQRFFLFRLLLLLVRQIHAMKLVCVVNMNANCICVNVSFDAI